MLIRSEQLLLFSQGTQGKAVAAQLHILGYGMNSGGWAYCSGAGHMGYCAELQCRTRWTVRHIGANIALFLVPLVHTSSAVPARSLAEHPKHFVARGERMIVRL